MELLRCFDEKEINNHNCVVCFSPILRYFSGFLITVRIFPGKLITPLKNVFSHLHLVLLECVTKF